MSMPSDVNPDVSEALERTTLPPRPRGGHVAGERLVTQFTPEQRGWAVAALVAFLGVAIVGPALTRTAVRGRKMQARVARRARDVQDRAGAMRDRASAMGARTRKSLRRLGGGSLPR